CDIPGVPHDDLEFKSTQNGGRRARILQVFPLPVEEVEQERRSFSGNGDSKERCVPLGIVLSDYNPRSGSSGPALHTGKNTPGITGGCGQTKNVTEPLLQFRGDPRKPWIKREVFIEGCQTVAGPMYS
ncbi:unnamed protein product, partial [Porites lobata]